MENIKTIDIHDPLWDDLTGGDQDVFNRREYLIPFTRSFGAECRLFYQDHGSGMIGHPLFIKGTDSVSPWYYGGPITRGDLKNDEIDGFYLSLSEHLKKEGIVSSFIRINPYARIGHFPGSEGIRNVYWIDPGHPEPHEKGCRNAISKAMRDGIRISEGDLRSFHRMYIQNMIEKDAPSFYRFPLAFVEEIRSGFNERFVILEASLDDLVISSAIFLYHQKRMYYFLAARDRSSGHAGAQSLIIMEAARIAAERGIDVLDLGGGPAGSGLERFKRSFTNTSKPFRVMKMVHDRDAYREKCLASGITNPLYERASYFPEYPSKF